MVDINTLTVFLGWCSVINIGVLLFTTILLVVMKGPISRIHSKIFGVSQPDLAPVYIQYLSNYKIVIFIFNIVPYTALKVMV
ncbi:hypothetical protein IH824_18120 [candidate division KSB1 bacterium]|nr:hypothetical protein [candidate division KSB1 bacterium]MCH8874650.1 hypothetical protein [candidate division KSB1 bacterium]